MSAEANRRYRQTHAAEIAVYKERYRRMNEAVEGTTLRCGHRWTKAENAAVLDPNRPTDWQLSQELGRTVQAIQAQRVLLRKRAQGRPA